MQHFIFVIILRFLMIALSTVGFIFIIQQVHDYSQTRISLSEYKAGTAPFFPIIFYFVNEASSGLKYKLTGNRHHLDHYPLIDEDGTGEAPRREYEAALLNAIKGDDWHEQVRLSQILALGWGVKINLIEATSWYLISKQTATDIDEIDKWEIYGRRIITETMIKDELRAIEFSDNAHEPWVEIEDSRSSDLIFESQRG